MIDINSESLATTSVINDVEVSVDNQMPVAKNDVKLEKPNFALSFRPIYYCSRVFGLMPFTIIYDSNDNVQKPKVGLLDSLWFLISICSYLIMAYISCQRSAIYQNIPYVFSFGVFMIFLSSQIFGALIIVMDMCNRFRLVDILKKIVIFDKEVSEIV